MLNNCSESKHCVDKVILMESTMDVIMTDAEQVYVDAMKKRKSERIPLFDVDERRLMPKKRVRFVVVN